MYGNDKASDVFHTNENIPRDQMVCRAVKKVHDEIKASVLPDVPLIWSEFNAAYDNQIEVTDSIYMGPWLATTISQCDGLTQMMSYWTFSDVFEEQGVVKEPFYGGFGLVAAGGIPKPSYYAFQVLHRLGDQRLENANPNVLVTKTSRDALVIALWNITNPREAGAAANGKTRHQGSQAWLRSSHQPCGCRPWKHPGAIREDGQTDVTQRRVRSRSCESSRSCPLPNMTN